MRRSAPAILFALGYAVLSSLGTTLSYAMNDWESPRFTKVPLAVNLGVNVLAAVMIGLIIDGIKGRITTRWRAVGVGVAMGIVVMSAVYFTVLPVSLSGRQLIASIGWAGLCGGTIGAAAWLPSDEYG